VVNFIVVPPTFSVFVPRLLSNRIAELLPVPLKARPWGLPGASSLIVTLAVRPPRAIGANVTEIVQVAFTARLAGQLWEALKSEALAPVTPMLDSASGAVPELRRVELWAALVVPTSCEPKLRLVGVSVTAGAVPVPLRETLCGLPGASSVTLTEAAREPVALGWKPTVTVQLDPAASVAGLSGQALVWLKSPAFAPPRAIAEIVSAALPVFCNETLCVAPAVPTRCEPNARVPGLRLTAGAGFVPVPLRPRMCGVPGALSAICTDAVLVPVPMGVNVTEIVQLAFTARLPGQSFDSE
jgi:hypothetical protein